MDLFFVLSGFLITRILLQARATSNYFGVFYYRRLLRIFPVYYAGLLIIFFILPVATRHGVHYPWSVQVWYWFNISNLHSAFFPLLIPLATVYWSLAVEEQFYALWPAIVRICSEQTLLIVALGGIVFSTILRNLNIVQAYNKTYPNLIYRLTPFHLDGLLMGSTLAIAIRSSGGERWARRLIPYFALIGGALILMGTTIVYTKNAPVRLIRYGYSGLDLFYLSLVAVCVVPTGRIGGILKSCLSLKILRNFGKFSYFIYVFHLLVIFFVNRVTDVVGVRFRDGWKALFGLGICYGLGALSWRYFESPILSLKRHFPYFPDLSKPAVVETSISPGQ